MTISRVKETIAFDNVTVLNIQLNDHKYLETTEPKDLKRASGDIFV